MLPSFCTDTITVTRAAYIDERGSKVRDWANATTSTVTNCSVQPATTTGDNSERENVQITMVLYAPAGSDVIDGDRITFGGITYEIVGHPFTWYSPTGTTSHLTCNLKDWQG